MRTTTQTAYERALLAAIREITSALDRALDLERLAGKACLSVFHFHRMFRGLAGETPLEMHRRLRLERAAAQLLDTDEPVTRIAFDAGYETHEAFTRAFRASYDCTPSRFRGSRATVLATVRSGHSLPILSAFTIPASHR